MMPEQSKKIQSNLFYDNGQLISFSRFPKSPRLIDVAVIIINYARSDLTDLLIQKLKKSENRLKLCFFVINTGANNYHHKDIYSVISSREDFKGTYFGYNLGILIARSKCNFKYSLMATNRITFDESANIVERLVVTADKNPRIAILYPQQIESKFTKYKQNHRDDLSLVISGTSEAFLIRSNAIEDVGFLNPDFIYSLGADVEYSFKLYSKGWQMAYYNKARVKHLKDFEKNSFQERDFLKAREFSARYFVEHYGKNWDQEFTEKLPEGFTSKNYSNYRREWESVLSRSEKRSYTLKKSENPDLKRQIEALNPWYYELKIGDIKVIPGKGSKQTAQELRGRITYRSKLLVDEVVKRYDFFNKRLLDIASNCGYWSARYAELGAKSMLAVEGRLEYVKQGLLYWEHNNFMKKNSYKFIHGNILNAEVWKKIRSEQPFDFTICAGILYHIPDYEKLIRLIASVTKKAILIDTRVSNSSEYINEPGGWCFDAIIETRNKRVPELNDLFSLLTKIGYRVEKLSIDVPIPIGLKGVDDYTKGRRVVLLARK